MNDILDSANTPVDPSLTTYVGDLAKSDPVLEQVADKVASDNLVVPAIPAEPPPPPFVEKPKRDGKGQKAPVVALTLFFLLVTTGLVFVFVNQQSSLNDIRNSAGNYLYPGEECIGGYRCNCGGGVECNKNVSMTCDQYCGRPGAPPPGNNLPGGPCGNGTVGSTGKCALDKACDPGTNTCKPITGTGNCTANLGNCYVTSGIGVGSDGRVCSAGGHWTTCSPGYECRNSDCVPPGGGGGTPPPGGGTNPPPGNTPTPTPPEASTPTPTPIVAQCTDIKIYKGGVVVVPSTLDPGDDVVIAVTGGNATKARVRVNGGSWNVTTTKNANGEYIYNYTIPADVTNFTVQSEIYGLDGAWH